MTNNEENSASINTDSALNEKSPCIPEAPVGAKTPLGMALLRVNRSMIFENNPMPELTALPIAQLKLLWTVRYLADATMKDFSERLQVSQSTVTQLADQLVKRKFIERTADAHDRRVVRLRLSGFGKKILQQDEEKHQEMFEAVWGKLTEEGKSQVMTGLTLLGDAAEGVLEDQGRPLKRFFAPPMLMEGDKSGGDSTPQPVLDLMTRRVRGHS